jgi:hypothetical protein
MGIAASNRPSDLKFLGAHKASPTMVIYTLDSRTSVLYLSNLEVMAAFMKSFDSMLSLKPRTYQIIVEHALISLDPTSQASLQEIERSSAMPVGSVHEARWLKPAHRR